MADTMPDDSEDLNPNAPNASPETARSAATPRATNDDATASRPAATPATPKPAADPYGASPTGFVSFDKVYGDNAKAATEASSKVVGGVQDAQAKAAQDLATEQEAYRSNLRNAAAQAVAGGTATPEFNPSQALQDESNSAQDQAHELGSVGGIQALMGSGGNAFGATLARRAGGAGLGAAESGVVSHAGDIADARAALAEEAKTAQGDATRQKANADLGAKSRADAVAAFKAGLGSPLPDGTQIELGVGGDASHAVHRPVGYEPTDEDLAPYGYGSGSNPYYVAPSNRGY